MGIGLPKGSKIGKKFYSNCPLRITAEGPVFIGDYVIISSEFPKGFLHLGIGTEIGWTKN